MCLRLRTAAGVPATPSNGEPLPNSSPPSRAVPSLEMWDLVPPEFFPSPYSDWQDWSFGCINELSILLNDCCG
ncbi:hypothetical protein PHYSODRAFT_288676 [Phytophthora sojae]|uniref:Uncharacterized protein n=1 Tax=Phytophthora sojae (strain P6497) TaxID=1094619 RepID=G5A6X2_PHYSP|nr:hypothetical protein PHYSODRAFT_288676 [Phytophthora sojae]EGZ09077.1 hypothetical protein PHYSODRAFT_288676 [Phytophthora sojae]|eukprot:XP_009535710.1 hypothetical protein PHYSODRAFT_288676 [Phytophthora sojae]